MKLLVVATLLLAAAACGDDDPAVAVGEDRAPVRTGVVTVRPVSLGGSMFIEGFEAGIRFETLEGEVLASTLWSDVPAAAGANAYDAILEQEVPAGSVVVLATVTIGPGGPPATPDLDGPLDCRLEVDVPADGRVDVQFAFGGDDCLTLLP